MPNHLAPGAVNTAVTAAEVFLILFAAKWIISRWPNAGPVKGLAAVVG